MVEGRCPDWPHLHSVRSLQNDEIYNQHRCDYAARRFDSERHEPSRILYQWRHNPDRGRLLLPESWR